MVVGGNRNNLFSDKSIKNNTDVNYKVGVLGGIGPEATGEFYNKLIQELQKKGLIRSNRDFPQIIINIIPAPELIYEKVSNEELEPYIRGLKELDQFGVDFIVMVCNTVHLYHNKLQKEIQAPIIDLRYELKQTLERRGIKRALVIGTPNTVKKGLYTFEDVECFEPNTIEMRKLTDAIFNFNRGTDKQKQIQKVKNICQKYLDRGAETVVLGCTEFAAMLGEEKFSKINTIDILVKATVDGIYSQPNPIKKEKKGNKRL